MNIKLILCRLKGNAFIQASFFSAISSFTKIVTSLILGKIIAVKLGAEGMALFGQLLSFVTIVLVVAGGSINQGVIKYVAEFISTDKNKLKNLLSTSFKIIVYSCTIAGLLLIFGSKYFAKVVLHNENYFNIFIVFGFTLVFYGLNNLFLSIVNGHKEFKKTNIINIVLNIASLILSLFFIYSLNVFGVLLSVVANQSVTFFITLYLLRKEKWMSKDFLLSKVDVEIFKKLSGFALLAIASSALAPLVSIVIRNYIIDSISLEAAGLYEFVNRISGASIMFFSLTISTYYLPRVAEIQRKDELIKEVKNTYKIVVPTAIVILWLVYFMRFYLIKIFASPNFNDSSSLFFFQLIGDLFKVCSLLIGFQLVAKAKIKLCLFTEIFFNLLLVMTSVFFTDLYGLIGASYAYSITYLIYFILMILIYKHLILKRY